MKLNKNIVAFTGGGTGGHIYPGLAVADQLKITAKKNNQEIKLYWLGCGGKKAMDKKIVSAALSSDNTQLVDKFYGIPSGKLRRYFSLKNISDLFKIAGGFFSAFHILRKLKPAVLFSKGGFVSVPPCIAARLLKIPVYTHECDFTLGLANRINFKSAAKMFVSYEETKSKMPQVQQNRIIVSGNPVRPVFYNTNKENGYKFLNIDKTKLTKPVLLVLGGSSGAKQINELVFKNLEWLCSKFVVVHQTGLVNNDETKEKEYLEKYGENYKPYAFIYEQMPDVLACSDLIMSRAGANSIWEATVLYKPMLLIPLCGSGTRGDQVDNARYFEKQNAAVVLAGSDATAENMKTKLDYLLQNDNLKTYSENVKKVLQEKKPVEIIAEYLYEVIK